MNNNNANKPNDYIMTITGICAFTWGFYNGIGKNTTNILERPLATVFNGAIAGVLYSVGATIVSNVLPNSFKFVVPVCTSIALASDIKNNHF